MIYWIVSRNARLVDSKNTTVVVMKEDFNQESFESALRRILSDSSYAVNAKRLASLMVNKPFPVKERLLSTVEFSTHHGKIENLDSYGRNLNTLQYYSIDVGVFLISLGFITVTAFVQLWSKCKRSITSIKYKVD
ncbi:hypothetical protein OESDEN_17879 [Oesophagostomum dentatum]|uniref:glucuronosyltransferase n=1 Tax=Oesophagostomum dentatum TaxID=61180 RepID=A0A0B1SFV5_OESDE|nr:hypothetical protein OESDEN_17879 [Oesophagostomum dentatum]